MTTNFASLRAHSGIKSGKLSVGGALAALLLTACVSVPIASGSAQALPRVATPTCTPSLSALLVPTCGTLFGSTINTKGSERSSLDSIARQEAQLGRPLDIVHTYYAGAQSWPYANETALVTDRSRQRYLFANWKPENGSTWAQVAAGRQDALIDAAAARIKQRLQGRPFFLAIHHEPENDLNAGIPGMRASDYQAMFRHVVQRLRADGAKFVSVWVMMSWHTHGERGLYSSAPTGFYPGDDVVDWIGADPYLFNGATLKSVIDQTASRGWPGFYTWATRDHRDKPIMLAEVGVSAPTTTQRAAALRALPAQVAALPAIKAVVAFNHGVDKNARYDYSLDTNPTVLSAARAAFSSPPFVRIGS